MADWNASMIAAAETTPAGGAIFLLPRFLALFMGGQGGGVPFSIHGTASDPKFVSDIKSMAGNAIARKVSSAVPDSPLTGIRGRGKRQSENVIG
jgi:hypothetical protein